MRFCRWSAGRSSGATSARRCRNGSDNPEARFCLIHLDVDLYEPHTVILDHCWDRVVPGGVVVLDEYSTRRWPGATRAWDDFATRRGLRLTLNRFPWANTPGAFIVKT